MKHNRLQLNTFSFMVIILLFLNCGVKKDDSARNKAILSALTAKSTSIEPKIPVVPNNFDFSLVKKNIVQMKNIPNSNGITKPFLTITLKEDFSEKVFSGFVTPGQTFTLPLVLPNTVNTLYYRLYSNMETATSGTLTRSNDSFTINN